MKITFTLGFNGGQLLAEVDNFAEADEVVQYALRRGILYGTPSPDETPTADDAPEAVTEEGQAPAEVAEDVPVAADVAEDVLVAAEEARVAIKGYAAEHGLEKGRELLGQFGLKRTSEITDEVAAAIVEACRE